MIYKVGAYINYNEDFKVPIDNETKELFKTIKALPYKIGETILIHASEWDDDIYASVKEYLEQHIPGELGSFYSGFVDALWELFNSDDNDYFKFHHVSSMLYDSMELYTVVKVETDNVNDIERLATEKIKKETDIVNVVGIDIQETGYIGDSL